jgi:hypothetical protein
LDYSSKEDRISFPGARARERFYCPCLILEQWERVTVNYEFVKELNPECLLFTTENGKKVIWDKILFDVPLRDNILKKVHLELRDFLIALPRVEEEGLILFRSGKISGRLISGPG